MNKLILILFCFTNLSFSQSNIEGLVKYKVSSNISNKVQQKQNYQLQKILKNARDVNANLFFTKGESLYQLDDPMANEANSGINVTQIFAGSDNVYYLNLETDERFKQTSTLGEYFRVTYSLPMWDITKQKKEISGYTCYKAILLEEGNQVVAWFSPELSFSYGPMHYNGLPGLILELRNSKLTFEVEKIELNSSIFHLEKPTKGRIISPEEYKEIAKKSMPNFFNKD